MFLDDVGKRSSREVAAKPGAAADGGEHVVAARGQPASVPPVAEFELERTCFRDPRNVVRSGRLGVAQRGDLAVDLALDLDADVGAHPARQRRIAHVAHVVDVDHEALVDCGRIPAAEHPHRLALAVAGIDDVGADDEVATMDGCELGCSPVDADRAMLRIRRYDLGGERGECTARAFQHELPAAVQQRRPFGTGIELQLEFIQVMGVGSM
jgi:hypothetical protein